MAKKEVKKYWCKLCNRYHKDKSAVKQHEERLKRRSERLKHKDKPKRVKKEQTTCPLCGQLHRIGSKRLIAHSAKFEKQKRKAEGTLLPGDKKHLREGVYCELCKRYHKKGAPQIDAHKRRLEKKKLRAQKKSDKEAKKLARLSAREQREAPKKVDCEICGRKHRIGSPRYNEHILGDKPVRELKREEETAYCSYHKQKHKKSTKRYHVCLNKGYIEGYETKKIEERIGKPNWCVICGKDKLESEMGQRYCKGCEDLIRSGDESFRIEKTSHFTEPVKLTEWRTLDEYSSESDIRLFDKWASRALKKGLYRLVKYGEKFLAIVMKNYYNEANQKYYDDFRSGEMQRLMHENES